MECSFFSFKPSFYMVNIFQTKLFSMSFKKNHVGVINHQSTKQVHTKLQMTPPPDLDRAIAAKILPAHK